MQPRIGDTKIRAHKIISLQQIKLTEIKQQTESSEVRFAHKWMEEGIWFESLCS